MKKMNLPLFMLAGGGYVLYEKLPWLMNNLDEAAIAAIAAVVGYGAIKGSRMVKGKLVETPESAPETAPAQPIATPYVAPQVLPQGNPVETFLLGAQAYQQYQQQDRIRAHGEIQK